MKAKDLLSDVRYSLSDTSKHRWSDARLLSLLTDGIKEIAKTTTLFVENIFVVVQDDVVDIDLRDKATKIIRVEYLDEPLPLYTFEEMDAKNSRWQLETGSKVKAIVYNKQERARVKLYPIVTNALNDNITYSSPYGIVTEISYSDILPVLANSIGDIASIPNEAVLKFYYIRKHAKVVDIEQDLYIDELCEVPLKHYIIGMALRDNQDTQNRTIGNEELKLYEARLEEFSLEKSKNFNRARISTSYNPMGD